MDSFVDVHMRPSEKIVHRYGDMLLGVFFLKESTFTVQEGLGENPEVFHSGTARAYEMIVPIHGKYPLPLSGFNYDPGCLPMCFMTDKPDSAFFVFGLCHGSEQHRDVAKSTKWLGSDGEVLYTNMCRIEDNSTTIRLTRASDTPSLQ